MGSMLGLVLADNLLALFVFWELTSISSYFLIGFNHERRESRAAALQALLVTGGGGLALLAGLLLLGQAGGNAFELSALLNQTEDFRSHPLYVPTLLLILVGAFTKSAQFPFHFWLPNAMEAPTPVSAYLHSATMVKAGIYLLARLSPALGGTEVWFWCVTLVEA
jgi:multicomponent Na+:H+ antiporter subunit A